MKNTIFTKTIAILLIVFALAGTISAQYEDLPLANFKAAIIENDPAKVNRLIDEGMNVNARYSGNTFLHWAIEEGKPEMVRLLLARGADPHLLVEGYVPGYKGLNALQLAEKYNNQEIITILKQAMGAKPSTEPNNNRQSPAPQRQSQPNPNSDSTPSNWSGAARQIPDFIGVWEKGGRIRVGDTVLHSRDRGKTWKRGTVVDIKPIQHVPNLAGVPFYVVDNGISRDWIDRAFVTTVERQSYWTEFFVGDWNLTLPMAMTERSINGENYNVLSGANRLPPLRINSDGTYVWTTDGNKTIRGRWQANENAPGLILLAGNGDWLLYNTSDSVERQVHKTDTARLVSKSDKYTPLHGFRIQKKQKP
jgi:hypothetical protein